LLRAAVRDHFEKVCEPIAGYAGDFYNHHAEARAYNACHRILAGYGC
jgi:hypothetical protein